MAQVKEHPAAILRRAVETLAGEGTAADLIAGIEAIAYTNVGAASLNDALARADRLPSFADADRRAVYFLACQAWSPWTARTPVHASDFTRGKDLIHGVTVADDAKQVIQEESARGASNDLPAVAKRFVDSLIDQCASEESQADVFRTYTSFSPAWELVDCNS